MNDLTNEILIMKKANSCENITHLKELFEDEDKIYMIMKYQEGGDLMEKLIKEKKLPSDEARQIMKHILLIVDFMHKLGIIHRDLKP